MRPATEEANQHLQNALLGACVESFGLTHQVLTLTFRDNDTNDHTLWIETTITANAKDFDSLLVDETARALLLCNSVNLQSIIAVRCTDEQDLIIDFANGIQLTLDGTADEYGEPWTFNLSFGDYSIGIITNCGAGFLIFDARNQMIYLLMPYSLPWLQQQPPAAIKFLFFWGHTPKQPGVVDKSCFSQWFPAAFTVEGAIYPTAEHWMMAEKARLFGDEDVRQRVLAAPKPGEAKKLGRQVRGFEPAAWDEVKFNLVVAGNYYKFSQHEALQAYLLTTGDHVLVEASPVDAIWGNGLAADHPDAGQPARWPGENLLGFALMAVRDQLRSA